jgi:putative membrane protein
MATGGGPADGWSGHMMSTPYGGLMMLIILAAVVYFVFIATRGSGRSDNGPSPLDTLNQRYAKGEIDKETYERMKKDIEGRE